MIDLHCHILPGLDDGPADLGQSLAMCRQAAADGITHLVATPHLRPPVYAAEKPDIQAALTKLREALTKDGIALTLISGAEVNLVADLPALARGQRLPFINDNGRYFFLELNEARLSEGLEGMIFELKLLGITPILTHPERTQAGGRDWQWLARLVELGCLTQVTAMSLTGEFGRRAQQSCEDLLEQNLAHFLATDAHSPKWRPVLLSPARRRLEELVGENAARDMLMTRPLAVLAGKGVEVPAPRLFRRRWWHF